MANRTSPKPNSDYNCEQDELYATGIIGWNSCKENIAQFTLLKPLYTLSYVAGCVTEITAAAIIPGAQARKNAAEKFHIQLTDKTNQCLYKWQDLKSYMVEAYPKDLLKINLKAAGEDFYRQASNYNWEKVSSLMIYGSQFIANNSAELQAGNNMPATFAAQFNQLSVETTAVYVQFQAALESAEQLTTQKINANNAVYDKMMKMMKDGQRIFRHDRAAKERFIFSHILERVRGASNAFRQFTLPANSSTKIENIVANSPFTNNGDTELVVCNGDVVCTVGMGITVQAGATIILAQDVSTITVLNTDATIAGKCRVRVTKN